MATPSPAPNSPTALYNVEVEFSALSALLQHPTTWGDFYLIERSDWSKATQPLWDIVSGQLGATPQGSVAPLLLSERPS